MANPNYAQGTFTPEATCKVSLLVDYDALVGTGNDWSLSGNYATVTPFILQNSVYSYGSSQRMGTSLQKFTLQHTALVASGSLVTYGAKLECFGLSAATIMNCNGRAELLKETST